nr:hypothetical protein [Myceligenerans salitolerans]
MDDDHQVVLVAGGDLDLAAGHRHRIRLARGPLNLDPPLDAVDLPDDVVRLDRSDISHVGPTVRAAPIQDDIDRSPLDDPARLCVEEETRTARTPAAGGFPFCVLRLTEKLVVIDDRPAVAAEREIGKVGTDRAEDLSAPDDDLSTVAGALLSGVWLTADRAS